MKFCLLAIVSAVVLLASGCTPTQQYAAGGAGAGAAAGAIIGHQSGSRDKGALIGAGVGALAGTAFGQKRELDQTRSGQGGGSVIVECPSCQTHVDVTGFPARSTVACPNCRSQFTY